MSPSPASGHGRLEEKVDGSAACHPRRPVRKGKNEFTGGGGIGPGAGVHPNDERGTGKAIQGATRKERPEQDAIHKGSCPTCGAAAAGMTASPRSEKDKEKHP